MPRKPAAISRGPLKAHPRKPPVPSDGRWYWQVLYSDGRKQRTALHQGKPAHRRGSLAQIRAHLDAILEAGTWKQWSKAPSPMRPCLS